MCIYPPEGAGAALPPDAQFVETALARAAQTGEILQTTAVSCTSGHDLVVELGGRQHVIERSDADLGVSLGKTRDIAIMSRVGKSVSFAVLGKTHGGEWRLSRAEAQRRALAHHMEHTPVGGVIRCRVTHMESFGVFVDVGCGAVSFIGIENISVSRIAHPRQRFAQGQDIYAAVLVKDGERLTLTHRELLGTWEQNAARVRAGSTLRGIVRSIKDYGAFVELLPNLSGLAEPRAHLRAGDSVSVYVKSISPSAMKIKLAIIDILEKPLGGRISAGDYFITCGSLKHWRYSPAECAKTIGTTFVTD